MSDPRPSTKSENASPKEESVTLFAPMGSNPALLVTTAWALWRQRGLRMAEAHVVVTRKGHEYAQDELLAPGAALDELHAVCGPDVLPRSGLSIHLATLADGTPVEDSLEAAHATAYQDAVLRHAKQCVAAAGEHAVVFALMAGRRRTMTVMAGLVAQFLARSHDHVVELRIEPRGADRPNRFFFPEQRDQESFQVNDAMLTPAQVDVRLVEVELPRLGALLPAGLPDQYSELIAIGQNAIDQAAPLRLEIRLGMQEHCALIHDAAEAQPVTLPLSRAELLHLASLVQARQETPEGWLSIKDVAAPDSGFGQLVIAAEWASRCKSLAVRHYLLGGAPLSETHLHEAIETLRGKTTRKLRAFARGRDARYQNLVPEKLKDADGWRERLPLTAVTLSW